MRRYFTHKIYKGAYDLSRISFALLLIPFCILIIGGNESLAIALVGLFILSALLSMIMAAIVLLHIIFRLADVQQGFTALFLLSLNFIFLSVILFYL